MTVLSAIQQACATGIPLTRPTSVFGSSEREHLELAGLAIDAAAEIAKAHDWELLTRLATFTGDGSTTAFDLPSDYDRMLVETQLWSNQIDAPLVHVKDRDRWLGMQVRGQDYLTPRWIKLGNQIHFNPALGASETVQFYYVSNLLAQAEDASTKVVFTADTDSFRLDETLLSLSLVWKWRSLKKLDYAEELASYERRRAQLSGYDKGPEIIVLGRGGRRGLSGEWAYPKTVSDA